MTPAPIARPIIFSAPMIRALLDGRKTQTRRVLKPAFEYMLKDKHERWKSFSEDHWQQIYAGTLPCGTGCIQSLPYAPGDRLWVREAACVNYQSWHHKDGHRHGLTYKAGGGLGEGIRAGEAPTTFPRISHNRDGRLRFASPIHMPRWASRLTLTVSDVRVQRVQEISEEDARAEGVEQHALGGGTFKAYGMSDEEYAICARGSFKALWDSLNAKRGFGWDANPWVVALTFTVERRNVDAQP